MISLTRSLDYIVLKYEKKWYHRLFFHLVDMTLINAWLLYRRKTDSIVMSLHEFKASVAQALCRSGAVVLKRGRSLDDDISCTEISNKRAKWCARVSCSDIRLDGSNHFPKMITNRQRCKRDVFSGQSRLACIKYGVHLCMLASKTAFLHSILLRYFYLNLDCLISVQSALICSRCVTLIPLPLSRMKIIDYSD